MQMNINLSKKELLNLIDNYFHRYANIKSIDIYTENSKYKLTVSSYKQEYNDLMLIRKPQSFIKDFSYTTPNSFYLKKFLYIIKKNENDL